MAFSCILAGETGSLEGAKMLGARLTAGQGASTRQRANASAEPRRQASSVAGPCRSPDAKLMRLDPASRN
eukprot:568173-Prymnesium_polylepis.1